MRFLKTCSFFSGKIPHTARLWSGSVESFSLSLLLCLNGVDLLSVRLYKCLWWRRGRQESSRTSTLSAHVKSNLKTGKRNNDIEGSSNIAVEAWWPSWTWHEWNIYHPNKGKRACHVLVEGTRPQFRTFSTYVLVGSTPIRMTDVGQQLHWSGDFQNPILVLLFLAVRTSNFRSEVSGDFQNPILVLLLLAARTSNSVQRFRESIFSTAFLTSTFWTIPKGQLHTYVGDVKGFSCYLGGRPFLLFCFRFVADHGCLTLGSMSSHRTGMNFERLS